MMKAIDLANRKRNAAGEILEAGQDSKKNEILRNIVPKRYAEKHNSRTCHIHDLEYYNIIYNCLGISVKNMVGDRKRSFGNMMNALHRKIVELANMQSGGIGFIDFDSDVAAYIEEESDEEIIEIFHEFFLNLNMNTRKGCENPYVTFNFGLDTSKKGRRVAFLMLEAYEQGDDRGNPFIFPNMVFKMKSGVNREEDTENYDLYVKALSVTAKRMVPTYFNCDSTANALFPADTIGIMGCRTRVVTNVNGREGSLNRGNVACVTLNLVQMAYQSEGDMDKFYSILDENLADARGVLRHRFQTLCEQGMFEEYYGKGYYLGAESCNAREMLKNGTLSIGFIGLWDAMVVLKGRTMDSAFIMKEYYAEAIAIIRHMREYTDQITEEEHLNFSLLATAAEGVTGSFAQYDSTHQGKDFDVCKKGYYTNSFHVPVNMAVSYQEKIALEGEFHSLCNGGSITYVELREMPGRNVEAVQEIVEYACKMDCNYIGINFPMDYCTYCGYMGRIVGKCSCCQSDAIRRLRRVSGYLAEEDRFTTGKRKELKDRQFHMVADFMGTDTYDG